MSRVERAAALNPALFAFGVKPLRSLSRKEEATAVFEDRLRSVWAWIVARSSRFTSSLSNRERANLSTEDLVQRIVITLMERDALWDPKRGRYITFCERIMRNASIQERERARVVAAPSNAMARLRKYRAEVADRESEDDFAGGADHVASRDRPLSFSQRRTMMALDGVIGEVVALDDQDIEDVRSCTRCASSDSRDSLISAIQEMGTPTHAYVLARSYGLGGTAPESPAALAKRMGVTVHDLKRIKADASDRIRDLIRRRRDEEFH